MAGSLSIDTDPCIVLSVLPYNDGRRVVRILSQSLGTVALWVSEGSGKKTTGREMASGCIAGVAGLDAQGIGGADPVQRGASKIHSRVHVSGRAQKCCGVFSM